MKKSEFTKQIVLVLPLLIGCFISVFLIASFKREESVKTMEIEDMPKVITSAALTEAIDIADLSSAQFTYNGIATMYKNEKQNKVKCYIRYNANVKAGIDMKQITFKVEEEQKIIKVVLPEIEIISNPVDEKTLSFIPEKVDIDLKEVMLVCKEDAETEARESRKLIETAKENIKVTIEGLLYPVISPQGYSIVWE